MSNYTNKRHYCQVKGRGREKKGVQNDYSQETMKEAVDLVLNQNYSQRAAARETGVPQKSLNR